MKQINNWRSVMLAFCILFSFLVISVSADETIKTTEPPTAKKDKTDAVSTKDIIDRTLDKIPELKKSTPREKISTRPAAVTRAQRQQNEKLPLIWKLKKNADAAPLPATQKNDDTPKD